MEGRSSNDRLSSSTLRGLMSPTHLGHLGHLDHLVDLVDLASSRLGGLVLHANDDFFAEKENLLRPHAAVFREHDYTDRGKWMDGWETRRAFGRIEGHVFDWCIVKLGAPGVIAGLDVDTSFFRGNFPEFCSFEAVAIDGDPSVEALLRNDVPWKELVAKTKLEGNQSNVIRLHEANACGVVVGERTTHLRFKIYPDGGVARLRVYGSVVPDLEAMMRFGDVHDLAAVSSGGAVVACNDSFFGSRHNMIMPGRSVNMGDGWETRRKRVPGFDWSIVRLGARAGKLRVLEVDTNHFKGNCPESVLIEGVDAENATVAELSGNTLPFREVLPRTKLRTHHRHFFGDGDVLQQIGPISHLRVKIFPDGGISRLRLHAELAEREVAPR